MYTPAQFELTRKEIHELRVENAGLKRWHLSQKQRADKLAEENAILKRENDQLKKIEEKLQEKLKEIEKQRDAYKGMVFKAKKKLGSAQTIDQQRERGGQVGHIGHGRKIPTQIDHLVDVCLTHCPDCHTKLKHSQSTTPHTVTDLPHGNS